jgi:hypothetical protein
MSWMSSILAKIWGPLAEDTHFGLIGAGCLVLAWPALLHTGLVASRRGPILVVGLAPTLVALHWALS